jgi:hypothetical protein
MTRDLPIGQPSPPSQPGRSAKLSPRHLLPRLADLLLADVKAGVKQRDAGWRDLGEVGLTPDEVVSLAPHVELRGLSRVRISMRSKLQAVQDARHILDYQETLKVEESRLARALEEYLGAFFGSILSDDESGPILLAGLTEMIRASAPLLEGTRHMLDRDPVVLSEAPSGAAAVILEAVRISVGPDVPSVLRRIGFKTPAPGSEPHQAISDAATLARELVVDGVAARLGACVVTAVGAAWAVQCRLAQEGVALTTEAGAQRLAKEFWQRLKLPRSDIDATWRRVMTEPSQGDAEKLQLGLVLWSWPEAL